jgi:hypothetical protein
VRVAKSSGDWCNDALLRQSFVSVEVNDAFSEATIGMRDGSRMHFCHRVGERWARVEDGGDASLAAQVLATIAMFRLNARHLDVRFQDGTHWETRFSDSASGR